MIRKLGGEIIETDEWDERVTHVIAHVDGKRESMSEKVMAGLAGGRWVLTKRWVDKCVKLGSWVSSPALYITSEAVVRHRRSWHQHGPRAAVFRGIKVALLMADPRKNGVYGRIIRSGAGAVVKCHSLHQLCMRPPGPGEITHIIIDPWILSEEDPRHQLFLKFRNLNEEHELNIHFLYYKYLFMKIRQFPEPHHTDYSIFNPKIQEMGAKDFEIFKKQMPSIKRTLPLGEPPNDERKKKRLDTDADIVTLQDSDEEEKGPTHPPPALKLAQLEGLLVQRVPLPTINTKVPDSVQCQRDSEETGYVSQFQTMDASLFDLGNNESRSLENHVISSNEDIVLDDSNNSDIVEVTKEAGIVAIPEPESVEQLDNKNFQSSIVVEDDDGESDDDIQVLEQKLATSRRERGDARHYLETDKATSRGSKRVISSAKRASVYIPSQRDEYMRQHEPSAQFSGDNVEMVILDDSESDSEEREKRLQGEEEYVRSSDVKHGRDSETQQDEDSDKNDDIVEVHAPAPDIVNIESDTDEEEVDACSNSIDAEPDAKEPAKSYSYTSKYRSIPAKKTNLNVRSQREEYNLTSKEDGKLKQIRSQREEYLFTSRETKVIEVRSQREEFLLASRETKKIHKAKSQREEFLLAAKQQENVGVKIEEDLTCLAEVESESAPSLESNTEPPVVSASPNKEPLSAEFEYEDVFQEQAPAPKKVEVENIRQNIQNIFQDYHDVFQEPAKPIQAITIKPTFISEKKLCDKVVHSSPVIEKHAEKVPSEPMELDDESDFSLSEGEQEDEKDEKPQNISASTLEHLNKASVKINIGRLGPAKMSYHMKILQDYLERKRELAAPDVERQAENDKPMISALSQTPQKQSTSLLFRILATLNTRFTSTNELLSISHSPYVKQIIYDMHEEKPRKANTKISSIPSSVEVDFVHLSRKTDTEDDSNEDDTDGDEISEPDIVSKQTTDYATDALTCIRRLKMETCSTITPNSKVLNVLFKDLLLEESNQYVINSAIDYLNNFLFLHGNTTDRFVWHSTILSALRNLKDDKLFRQFNLSNAQDLVLCTEFWRDLIEKVIQNCLFTKYSEEYFESYDVESSGTMGPFMLLQFLVKLLEKDFQIWWQHHKKKHLDNYTDQVGDLPLLFYILGGSARDLLKTIKSTVLKLYKHFLKMDHGLAEVRTLLSMTAILVSHLDFHEEYG